MFETRERKKQKERDDAWTKLEEMAGANLKILESQSALVATHFHHIHHVQGSKTLNDFSYCRTKIVAG